MKYIVAFALFALVKLISADYLALVQEYPCQTDCYLRAPCSGCDAERSAIRPCTVDTSVYIPLGKCVYVDSVYRSFKRNNTHFNVFEYSSLEDCEDNFESDERNTGLDTDPEDPDKFVPVYDGYDLRIGYCNKGALDYDSTFMVKFVVDKDLPKDKNLEKGTLKEIQYQRPDEDNEDGAKSTCSNVYQIRFTRVYYNFAELNCSKDSNELIVSYTDMASEESIDRARQRKIHKESTFLGCQNHGAYNVEYQCGKESSAVSIVASLSAIVLAVLSIVHI